MRLHLTEVWCSHWWTRSDFRKGSQSIVRFPRFIFNDHAQRTWNTAIVRLDCTIPVIDCFVRKIVCHPVAISLKSRTVATCESMNKSSLNRWRFNWDFGLSNTSGTQQCRGVGDGDGKTVCAQHARMMEAR